MTRSMPAQKPGKSEQVVATPWELIDAVEKRFKRLCFDLAATHGNVKVRFPSRGKTIDQSYFNRGQDSLSQEWFRLKGNLWLNPPFGDIAPWAKKCAATGLSNHGLAVLFLIPASVGSNWWAEHVDKKADVYFLSPRVTFVGHSSSYPKDLALCRYHRGTKGLYECWRWKNP